MLHLSLKIAELNILDKKKNFQICEKTRVSNFLTSDLLSILTLIFILSAIIDKTLCHYCWFMWLLVSSVVLKTQRIWLIIFSRWCAWKYFPIEVFSRKAKTWVVHLVWVHTAVIFMAWSLTEGSTASVKSNLWGTFLPERNINFYFHTPFDRVPLPPSLITPCQKLEFCLFRLLRTPQYSHLHKFVLRGFLHPDYLASSWDSAYRLLTSQQCPKDCTLWKRGFDSFDKARVCRAPDGICIWIRSPPVRFPSRRA